MSEKTKKSTFSGRGRMGAAQDYRKPKNIKGTSMRLLGYMGKHKWSLTIVLVLMSLASVSGVAASYLLKPLLDECILPNIGLQQQNWSKLFDTLCTLGAIYLVGLLAAYFQAALMMSISNRTISHIRRDLFDHLQNMPISFFDGTENGELMSHFTNDADTVQLGIEQTVTSLLSSIITFTSVVVIMIRLNIVLFAITLVFVIIAAYISKKVGEKSKVLFKQQQRLLGNANAYVEEMVEGIKEVKAFAYEDRAMQHFAQRNATYKEAATSANFIGTALMPIMGQLMGICYAIITVVGAFFIIQETQFSGVIFTVGSLGVFLTYTKQLRGPIHQVSNQIVTMMSALAGAERIFHVMDEPVEIDQGNVTLTHTQGKENDAYAWKTQKGDVPVRGHIQISNISFSYANSKLILNDVTLEALPGQRIALVGSTGAGKTTVTNLVNRFYDVQKGNIFFDGINITDIAKDDLRCSMSIVLQDTHLFSGTVIENIRYGNMNASSEECVNAAKTANAYQFIMALPQGFDTYITGDGGSLSQGQCQLLNIARAVVAKRPVLILDEATSSVDTRTEQLIESGMQALMHGRTAFVIAHRMSTVRNADKIAVMENGKIIEFGSHAQLLAQGGRYYELYSGQTMLV